MSRHQVAWNATTKIAVVQAFGDALSAGSINAGDFFHDDTPDDGDKKGDLNGHNGSHVLYHHVRDVLYHRGVLDMQSVTIQIDLDYVALVSIAVTPDPINNLAVNATQQLAVAFTPGGASNKKVTYSTSNAARATVSNTGLVTGKGAGAVVITVTSEDGAKTDTVNVTVV